MRWGYVEKEGDWGRGGQGEVMMRGVKEIEDNSMTRGGRQKTNGSNFTYRFPLLLILTPCRFLVSQLTHLKLCSSIHSEKSCISD
jgi:hypothetical protein